MQGFDISQDPLLSKSVKESMEEWDQPVDSDASLESTLSYYLRNRLWKFAFIGICFVAIFLVAGYTITIGSMNISFVETYETIWNHLTGNIVNDGFDFVVWDLRMPRVLAGIIGGAGLAVCGAVMQNTMKNPLADPYTTGVSSGASLGATIAMTVVGGLMASTNVTVIGAFVFTLIPVGMMIAISKMKDASPTTMIMAGIGIMYIFNAITTVLMIWSDPQQMQAVYRWQVGTLDIVKWEHLPIMGLVTLAGVVISMLISGRLNVLSTGDESAKAMGIDADRMRIWCLVMVGLVSAVIVSFTGLIGFVGLVAPHITRLFIGSDNKFLIPACAVFGSMLLIVADALGRTILSPNVIQVGVVMSFVGGPIFLLLLLGSRKRMWSS